MSFLPALAKLFRSYKDSNMVSRCARCVLDLYGIQKIKKWFGYQIATATFVVAIVPLSTTSAVLNPPLPTVTPDPVVAAPEVKTQTTVAWPVAGPSITQGYHYGHPGIDIQGAPPIFPVDNGVVSDVIISSWGYGKHVIVTHPNGRSSLYGHMSKINVVKGQEVTRDTILGIMGRTGWATGIHLHLEIYQDGKPVNPLSVLPTK